MPEFRRDPTTGTWTIVAVERGARPVGRPSIGLPAPAEAEYDATCPFCQGNEHATPPEILRLPDGAGQWSVRVVPNKFPALVPDASEGGSDATSLLQVRPARGRHEVIIEGPRHRATAAPPEAGVLRDVLLAARQRYQVMSTDPGLQHVALFKNHGLRAGASLTHPHWQLVASPLVPPALAHELQIAADYRVAHQRTLLDDLIRQELHEGTRVVEATDDFAVLTAFAPQWLGETWIVPRAPGAGIGGLSDAGIEAFAQTLGRTLQRVASAFDRPPLNVVIHSPPLHGAWDDVFRWHTRIQPRLSRRAGYELGSGVAIVTLAPEAAAEALRRQPC